MKNIFLFIFTGVICIAVILGFLTVGSPGQVRKQEFDKKRVQDIQAIQNKILSYWTKNKDLPPNLDAISKVNNVYDTYSGSKQTYQDPKTKEAYTYTKYSDVRFTICAKFETEVPENESGRSTSSYNYSNVSFIGDSKWEHEIGKYCFDRTIDKVEYEKKYPVYRAQPAPIPHPDSGLPL